MNKYEAQMIKANKLALEKAKKLQVYPKKNVPEPSTSKDASKGDSAPPIKKFKAPKPSESPPVPFNPSLQESKNYLDFDLRKAHLTSVDYDDEWLAYGPIKGAAFRCVLVRDITKIGFHSLFAGHGYTGDGFAGHVYAGGGYARFGRYEATSDEDALPAAKKVGKLFQGDEDQSPDIVLAVTAAFLGAHYQGRGIKFGEKIADSVTHALSDELEALERPKPQSFGAFRLVNPIITCKRPALSFMTSLLLSLERRAQALQAKALDSSKRPSPVHYDLDIDGLEICSDDDV
ncbi:hypothetical protein KJ359_003008 [Pestalotiopsis sp. 9143b]|nr:hypothetical protein KJ359_003008 [Pestalotiopsis sp. 9143b]